MVFVWMERECTRYPIAFDTFAKFGFMDMLIVTSLHRSVNKVVDQEKRHGIVVS